MAAASVIGSLVIASGVESWHRQAVGEHLVVGGQTGNGFSGNAEGLFSGWKDLFVAGQEQNHLPLFVLDGHDVQQAGERQA